MSRPSSETTMSAIADAVSSLLGGEVAAGDLIPLPAKGVAHDHWHVKGQDVVVRLPRLTAFDLGSEANIAYQQAAFERARASGMVPRLAGACAPSPDLPRGVLVVERLEGRPPRLPDDLPAIARALARVHALPVPELAARPPLVEHSDALGGTLEVVRANLRYAGAAGLSAEGLAEIEEELGELERSAAGLPPQPVTLVLTDTHPGNFLIGDDGSARFTDVEKALYGSPAIDLAHATLPTSLNWDPDVTGEATPGDVRDFHAVWRSAVPAVLADALAPWIVPMRRLTWVRTSAFLMRWLVASAGEGDWSASRLGAHAARHFEAHARACLRPETMRRIRREWLAVE